MISNFLFHRVSNETDNLWEPMSPALFEKSISFISRNYEVFTIEEIILSGMKTEGRKIATISFDDGYRDNIEFAAPILEKYNCKASFYVVTECIDLNKPTWTYVIDFIFQNASPDHIELDYDFLPAGLRKAVFARTQDKMQYAARLKPFLKKLDHVQRNTILDQLYNRFSDVRLPEIMMSWDDLAELIRRGHTVGSHSHTHPMLGTIKNEEESLYELQTSFELIREKLGIEPQTISYPLGSYDETIIRQSKEVGYKLGVAVKQEVFFRDQAGIYEIPRIELYSESWFKTRLRITNRLERIKKLIKYK
ncbi:MAG: polysaccharide deacetylase family protein [Bacteroidota bacterium]